MNCAEFEFSSGPVAMRDSGQGEALKDRLRIQWPHLSALRLSDDDFQALEKQGFLSHDRCNGRKYFKLRFRRDNHQIVRYVGNEQQALEVQKELQQLQAGRKLEKDLRALERMSTQALRSAKDSLAPLIAEFGFRFHGRSIRRSRNKSGGWQ